MTWQETCVVVTLLLLILRFQCGCSGEASGNFGGIGSVPVSSLRVRLDGCYDQPVNSECHEHLSLLQQALQIEVPPCIQRLIGMPFNKNHNALPENDDATMPTMVTITTTQTTTCVTEVLSESESFTNYFWEAIPFAVHIDVVDEELKSNRTNYYRLVLRPLVTVDSLIRSAVSKQLHVSQNNFFVDPRASSNKVRDTTTQFGPNFYHPRFNPVSCFPDPELHCCSQHLKSFTKSGFYRQYLNAVVAGIDVGVCVG